MIENKKIDSFVKKPYNQLITNEIIDGYQCVI